MRSKRGDDDRVGDHEILGDFRRQAAEISSVGNKVLAGFDRARYAVGLIGTEQRAASAKHADHPRSVVHAWGTAIEVAQSLQTQYVAGHNAQRT